VFRGVEVAVFKPKLNNEIINTNEDVFPTIPIKFVEKTEHC